jgi:Outer membrane protein beta-barrel domain
MLVLPYGYLLTFAQTHPMKKLILTCLSGMLLSGAAKAQLSYGPELGVNLSNYRVEFPGFFPPTTLPIPGAHVGGIVNYRFSDHLAIEPGAFFSINGIKYTYNLYILGSITAVAHLNTIRIPVNVNYTFGEPGGNCFFVGAGPFFGINLGGSARATANTSFPMADSFLLAAVGTTDSAQKITAGNDSSDYIKRFDFGVGVNVGYQLSNGLFFRAGYTRGLLNMTPTAGGQTSAIHSVNYALSVGYYFGDRPKKKMKAKMNAPKKKTH